MKILQIGFEMLRATQEAAIAGSHWIGRGDKNAADGSAVDAIRASLNKTNGFFCGKIISSEGEKDNAPMLAHGEMVGDKRVFDMAEPYDIALDPLDGTSQVAKGGPEAMSVIAVADTDCLMHTPIHYMKKIAVGPGKRGTIPLDITWTIKELLDHVSIHLDKHMNDLTVCLLDRPRHEVFIREFRYYGCRIKLIADCDVSGAIASALPDSPVDIYYGIGGSPEGVITAAAMKCLGGNFVGSIDNKSFSMEDLAKGEVLFCATGVTSGSMLRGIQRKSGYWSCNSVLMHYPTKNVHWVTTNYA